MKQKIIKKTRKLLKQTPNLTNYDKIYHSFSWKDAEKEIVWFPGKKLNAAYNAIDRNVLGPRKNKIALYWQGENGERKKFTFFELYLLLNQFANLL